MQRLDLTQILLIVALVGASILGVNQCSTKNMYKRKFNEQVSINGNLIKEIDRGQASFVRLSKLNSQKDDLLKNKSQEISTLRASHRRLKSQLDEYTSDTLYARFKGSHELVGVLYDVDSTLLLQAEKTKLERIECEKINSVLQTEVDFLNNSLDEVMSMGIDQLDECLVGKKSLEGRLSLTEAELKESKKKIWTNRGIAGVALAALLVVAL